MNKTKKVKGFTLIELIVVIAIIGVLAAILVPTMLGYVKKSKCSSANGNAKNLYNAINTACVDIDSLGQAVTATGTGSGGVDPSGWAAPAAGDTLDGTDATIQKYIVKYFSDVKKLTKVSYGISTGAPTYASIQMGSYYGSYPTATTTDNCTTTPSQW